MRRPLLAAVISLAAAFSTTTAMAQEADAQTILSQPPVFERSSDVTVPLQWRAGKLALDAEANGVGRSFILDTGSPTILSADLARELGLTVQGRNVGQDANGRPVTMEIARLDRLEIGGLVIRDLPVLIFDFSALEIGACVMDGGVIGSDILPAGAWTLDMEAETLSLATEAPSSDAAALESYGYPFAPIVVYRAGDLVDRALIDTGGTGAVTLFDGAMDGWASGAAADAVETGQAFAGESAGGRGGQVRVRRARIDEFHIGPFNTGPLVAGSRPVAPTLIGVDILRTHRMTLNQPSGTLELIPRDHPDLRPADLGLGVEWIDGAAVVSRLMDNSVAARAGLRLGDRILAANGRDLEDAADPCGQALWLIETLAWAPAMTLTTARDPQQPVVLEP